MGDEEATPTSTGSESKTKFRVNHGGSGPEQVDSQVVHQVTDEGGGGEEEKNVTHANFACPIHLAPLTTPTAAAAAVETCLSMQLT